MLEFPISNQSNDEYLLSLKRYPITLRREYLLPPSLHQLESVSKMQGILWVQDLIVYARTTKKEGLLEFLAGS